MWYMYLVLLVATRKITYFMSVIVLRSFKTKTCVRKKKHIPDLLASSY